MSTEKATENSGFLDGRDYTAAFIYEFCALLVGNGVYAGELAPTATNENMTITHGSGHAWINGVCYKNTTPFVLDIATADGALNRYDSLMLRLDLSANETYAIIVHGEYATAPTPPACTRNAEIYDLKICDIYVPAGCTKITQDLITDTRMDASVCGVPVFPVDHLDLTTFYKQVAADLANFRAREQADFSAWVTGQEESHMATMAELVEIVRMTSDNSRDEILDLLRQLNELVEGDTVGELITAINEKLSKSGGTMTGALAMGGNKVTGLAAPTDSTDAATKDYADKMLPKSGGAMTGSISMGGNKITDLGNPEDDADAASKGYVDTSVAKAATRNLLDNSDFRNPVNQRGSVSYTGKPVYTIDRWKIYDGTLSVSSDGYVSYTGQFFQYIDGVDFDKPYTFAVGIEAGIVCVSGKFSEQPTASLGNTKITMVVSNDYGEVVLEPANGNTVGGAYWAALYEGEYTAATLPEYQPKGYGAELLECQRYFLPDCIRYANGVAYGGRNYANVLIHTPVTMRGCQINVRNKDWLVVKNTLYETSSIAGIIAKDNGVIAQVNVTSTFAESVQCCIANIIADIIADL